MQQYSKVSAEQLNEARVAQVSVHPQMAEFMRNYDVVLLPTLQVLPDKVEQVRHEQPIGDFYRAIKPTAVSPASWNRPRHVSITDRSSPVGCGMISANWHDCGKSFVTFRSIWI